MPTDYDAIAGQYQRAKQQPWRAHVEAYTFLELLGPLTGQAVLDLACGEGHYTRRLPGLGAARVVGVDRSQGMIDLARAQETERPMGIEYFVRDCLSLDLGAEFDVVTAAYLLNYARSREELAEMASAIARCLRPGGRFVTLNANPALEFDRGATYRPYGFEVRADGEPGEGMPYAWVFDLGDGPVEVENYWLPAPAYEAALRSAGFTELRWHSLRLAPEGGGAFPSGFWDDLLDHPPVLAIECLL